MNERELEAWLKTRPRKTQNADACLIAERAVFRCLQIAFSKRDQLIRGFGDLVLLRVLLTVHAAGGDASGVDDANLEKLDKIDAGSLVGRGTGSSRALIVLDAALFLISLLRKPDQTYRNFDLCIETLLLAFEEKLFVSSAMWVKAIDEKPYEAVGPGVIDVLANAREDMLREIEHDCRTIEAGMSARSIQKAGLWNLGRPSWYDVFSNIAEQIENELPEIWGFWRRFRISVEGGELLSREMLREIASIPNEVWDSGPEKVAEEIARIEAKYRKQDVPEDIEATLARMPLAKAKQQTRFADAVQTHREELPGTLEAILAYCCREIDRLQFRNAPYASAEEEAEAQRQIRVLTTIYTALDKLRQEIPAKGELSAQNIERGEKLTRVYLRAFEDWPRKNAEDIADSVYRAALVGASAVLLPMVGVSPTVAVTVGTVIFGGKKIADGVKAGKDLMK